MDIISRSQISQERHTESLFLAARERAICASIIVTVLSGAFRVSIAESAERPNVVLILADDLGFSDLGCYGSEIETPAIDHLAASGLRFTQFYNTARCWPTRASLMTGLYPHQARMAMNFGEKAPPAYSGNIPLSCRMIPELLRSAGYRSYHVGKWHLNGGAKQPNHTWPRGRGFEHSYFLLGHDNYFFPKLIHDDSTRIEQFPDDYYVTDALSNRAVKYLKEHHDGHRGEPFFLYLAYTAPHFPLHARADDVAHYRGRYRLGWDELRQRRYRRLRDLGVIDCPLSPRDPAAAAWDGLSDAVRSAWDARMAVYAAMITCMDRGIGRVVRQLESMRALDNTLILFLSDNGSSAEFIVRGEGHDLAAPAGSRKTFQCLEVGWSNAANTPFRMHKMWVHEGGIATPLVVHWPAGLRARGAWTRQVGHVIDVVPTLLEVCGAVYPRQHDAQPAMMPCGISLAPMFRGGTCASREFLFWEHQGARAIRLGDHKLVAEAGGAWELYNLRDDRSELEDLAKIEPNKVHELAMLWQNYADRIGVVPWETLPQSRASPSKEYRRK